jgi:hypothetical protein
MLQRNGRQCPYQAKTGSLCGVHHKSAKVRRRAIEKLIELGKFAGAATALVEFIHKVGPIIVKVTPILSRWIANGATVLHGRFLFSCPEPTDPDWKRQRLLEIALDMKRNSDYSRLSELAEDIFEAALPGE